MGPREKVHDDAHKERRVTGQELHAGATHPEPRRAEPAADGHGRGLAFGPGHGQGRRSRGRGGVGPREKVYDEAQRQRRVASQELHTSATHPETRRAEPAAGGHGRGLALRPGHGQGRRRRGRGFDNGGLRRGGLRLHPKYCGYTKGFGYGGIGKRRRGKTQGRGVRPRRKGAPRASTDEASPPKRPLSGNMLAFFA